jgi:GT2 family glycosyltransferase
LLLNIAVKKSKGDLILFIDSDCVAKSDWIEKYVKVHLNTNYAAIGGSVLNGNSPKNQIAWAGYLAEFRDYIPEKPQGEVDHIPTCNISYKSDIFKSLPGFNPSYYPQEDLEFNYRLKKAGHKIMFHPDIHVYHHHRTELHSFFNHQRRVGHITSTMLNILPLQGAKIARKKLLTAIFLPILPVVKWINTILLFIRLNPKLVVTHIPAVLIFAVGLIPWTLGFYSGVKCFKKRLT